MPVLLRTRGIRRRSVRPAEVRRRAERMLVALELPDAELSILLCDDETMRELNRDYRGKDRSTDVLAFAIREGAHGELAGDLLGDVVISLDTARRQAAESDRPIVAEVTFLLAHGLLHLLGHDHPTEAELRRMNALTDGLVAAARPFANE
ncbi:MAG: rRNA maturation RNase YbeY [Myxococcota bacterium]